MVAKRLKKDFLEDSEVQQFVEDILYPFRKKTDAVIAIQFGVPKGKEDEWREAISFASAHNTYSTTSAGRLTKHRVELLPQQAWEIHQFYQMLEKSPHLE